MRKKGIINLIGLLTIVAALFCSSAVETAAVREQQTFVLVHGAFGDQSVWEGPDMEQGVAEQLRQRGYRVVMVTLPGLGRKYRQADESINLESHVQHVLDVLEIDNVTDAVMVCHSYSGLVCAAVQDRVQQTEDEQPNRIARMVFFDAVVPLSGESFFSSTGIPLPEWFPSLEVYYAALHQAAGLPIPIENLWCFPNLPAAAFGLTDPEELAWLDARQHCQPIHTLDQPVSFSWNSDVRKYFVHTEVPWFSFTAFQTFKERAEAMDWNVYSVDDSHYVALSDPTETVRILSLIAYLPYDNWPFN